MTSPLVLAAATGLAAREHAGQRDAGLAPIAGHINRVTARAEAFRSRYARDLNPYSVAVVAVCHDLVEDTPVTVEHLARELRLDPGSDIIEAIVAITHLPYEPRAQYLQRVCSSDLAVLVKLADNDDNANDQRLAAVPHDEHRDRLRAKYARERQVLAQAVRERWGAQLVGQESHP